MAASRRSLLFLLLAFLLLAAAAFAQPAKILSSDASLDDDDEDLSFLEEDESPGLDHPAPLFGDGEFDDVPELVEPGSQDANESENLQQEPEPEPEPIDESDVVVLGSANFSDFIAARRYVMVEFYAPWCGHCQALAPEYAAAATELKEEEEVALAKVDATIEDELASRFEVQGFPTVLFFTDGVHKDYPGQRTKDAIVTWIRKKIGPGVSNITTVEEAEKVLASESKLVLGFFDSLVGSDSEELAAASKFEDGINFYQTVNSDVAKLFHIDANAKRPSLVLLKKEAEKLSYFDGKFSKSAISEFVAANKLPLVAILTRESAQDIFDNQIKNMVLLFAVSNETEKVIPTLQEAAKSFKNKAIFVYVERDEEDLGVPVSNYFGVTGDGPQVVAYLANEERKKYILDGEITVESIKKFAEDFLGGKLLPYFKSGKIPETNDGDVKIVVGKTFDDIVLDESKDVLLEIYAPWCGHCIALEPVYNKLAKHLRGIQSLVIAKMDGTINEHPRAMAEGFPTLLFFPAGKKSSDPILVDTERTAVALYKFIKKHAAVPFKIQKPASDKKEETTTTTTEASAHEDEKSSKSDDLKDEL